MGHWTIDNEKRACFRRRSPSLEQGLFSVFLSAMVGGLDIAGRGKEEEDEQMSVCLMLDRLRWCAEQNRGGGVNSDGVIAPQKDSFTCKLSRRFLFDWFTKKNISVQRSKLLTVQEAKQFMYKMGPFLRLLGVGTHLPP